MKISAGHLTYCSNIHSGEQWDEHFQEIKDNFPIVQDQLSVSGKMALGLRVSNAASIDLQNSNKLDELKLWLEDNNAYIFTFNGFPYGNFHKTKVKDQVHFPDWTTTERLEYSLRMFKILGQLLPSNVESGGISTSPLSYKFWFDTEDQKQKTTLKSTQNIIKVIDFLDNHFKETGQILHLDIEPEPDGLLSNSSDFIHWYQETLIPLAQSHFETLTSKEATSLVKKHIQLCYDICHFAVEFEDPSQAIDRLIACDIPIGKVQISSALEMNLASHSDEKWEELKKFDEPVYLHQVVIESDNGSIVRYADLNLALKHQKISPNEVWRIHYHVPIFRDQYDLLGSTQSVIKETMKLLIQKNLCKHYEVETYTWEVLPSDIQITLNESIAREVKWVLDLLPAIESV